MCAVCVSLTSNYVCVCELKLFTLHLNKYITFDSSNGDDGGERKTRPNTRASTQLYFENVNVHSEGEFTLPDILRAAKNSTFAGAVTNDESFRRYVTSALPRTVSSLPARGLSSCLAPTNDVRITRKKAGKL